LTGGRARERRIDDSRVGEARTAGAAASIVVRRRQALARPASEPARAAAATHSVGVGGGDRVAAGTEPPIVGVGVGVGVGAGASAALARGDFGATLRAREWPGRSLVDCRRTVAARRGRAGVACRAAEIAGTAAAPADEQP
jgi:hypothetical protein